MKNELQNIISGKSKVKYGELIQATTSYLEGCKGTSTLVENDKYIKSKESERLKIFIDENNLWVTDIKFNKFVSEGAEQRVYLSGNRKVIKLNDAIYYL